jgi:hypothetical protein
MKLTDSLLKNLNDVFDKDPEKFVALRVTFDGSMTWAVTDGVLTLTVDDRPDASLTYDLSQVTLRQLVDSIAGHAGYEVGYLDPDRSDLSGLVLLDGTGNQSEFNGDAIFGYSSLLWAVAEAFARGLQTAADQIPEAPRQLSTPTAAGSWLDELGSYYKVPRLTNEDDRIYGPRILAEVLRPMSNNIALERAIEDYTGQPCQVVDVTVYRGVYPIYDGSITYDGTYDYDVVGFPNYGLFDVSVAYDLINSGDISTFLTTVHTIVDRLRAAGTHLRGLALRADGTPLTDTLTAPTDTMSVPMTTGAFTDSLSAPGETFGGAAGLLAALADTFTAPTDAATGVITQTLTTADGATITDDSGVPILISTASIFT